MLLVGLLATPSAALAQRVLECRFVSVAPSSFAYGKWSFAADLSNGRLAMLLVRPGGDGGDGVAPYVRSFTPSGPGESVFHALTKGPGEDGDKAVFVIARLGADKLVTLDEWVFGDAEDHDRLILQCPSRP